VQDNVSKIQKTCIVIEVLKKSVCIHIYIKNHTYPCYELFFCLRTYNTSTFSHIYTMYTLLSCICLICSFRYAHILKYIDILQQFIGYYWWCTKKCNNNYSTQFRKKYELIVDIGIYTW
jgi:hypothetical protein